MTTLHDLYKNAGHRVAVFLKATDLHPVESLSDKVISGSDLAANYLAVLPPLLPKEPQPYTVFLIVVNGKLDIWNPELRTDHFHTAFIFNSANQTYAAEVIKSSTIFLQKDITGKFIYSNNIESVLNFIKDKLIR